MTKEKAEAGCGSGGSRKKITASRHSAKDNDIMTSFMTMLGQVRSGQVLLTVWPLALTPTPADPMAALLNI